MPTLYEYLGIRVFFYANDHEPVHIHGRCEERESIIEIIPIENAYMFCVREVVGRKPLKPAELSNLKELAAHYAAEIVEKWNDFFVKGSSIRTVQITQKLK